MGSSRVKSSRVEPSLNKENGRLSNTIGLRRRCRTGKGRRRKCSRNCRSALRERTCVLSKKQAGTELIGNTTGHVDGGQGKLLRSGVHITSPPDLGSRSLLRPSRGRRVALLGEQGCTREGGWQAVNSAAQNGRHAGARTGHEAAGLPDRPARRA